MTATASYAFTVRNVTEGRRSAAGELTLAHLGDVTVTLQGMTRAELAEWEWATDALALDGVDEAAHRLAMNGWKVLHGGEVVGLLFQGAGTRVHAEFYDPASGDFLAAGWAAKLRHGAALIVNARQAAGHGLPVDITPEPVTIPQPARPVWLRGGTEVRYHGSMAQLHGDGYRVEECECFECDGYQLYTVNPWRVVALHVGLTSVTAVDALAEAA